MEIEYINNFKSIYLQHINNHLFLIDDENDVKSVTKLKEVLEQTKFDVNNISLFNSIINKYNKIIKKWS